MALGWDTLVVTQMFLFADYRQGEARFFAETDLEPARAWLMS